MEESTLNFFSSSIHLMRLFPAESMESTDSQLGDQSSIGRPFCPGSAVSEAPPGAQEEP